MGMDISTAIGFQSRLTIRAAMNYSGNINSLSGFR
jgi:hypothetical protein